MIEAGGVVKGRGIEWSGELCAEMMSLWIDISWITSPLLDLSTPSIGLFSNIEAPA